MKPKNIAFVFAGQGAQKVGMGRDFYETYDQAKAVFDQLDPAVLDVCFHGPAEALLETTNTQQALLGFSLAVAYVLQANGITPSSLAGLSLGEYSALTYASSFSLEDALDVVSQRAMFMQEALEDEDTTMMAVLNASLETIQHAITASKVEGVCEIANINSPTQLVISGHTMKLHDVKQSLTKHKGVRVIPLKVAGAFHSSLLEEASKQLETVLKEKTIQQPSIPVVFNATAKTDSNNMVDLLVAQIKSTVLFEASIERMIADGVELFIEISPKSTLCGLIKKINQDVACVCVSDIDSLNKLLEEV